LVLKISHNSSYIFVFVYVSNSSTKLKKIFAN